MIKTNYLVEKLRNTLNSLSNTIRKLQIIIVVLPLILLESLYFYQHLVKREIYLFSDDAVYAILAQRFLNGDFLNSIHTYWNPGFPLATIPFYLLSGSWEMAQILVSMASILMLTIAVFLFYKRISLIFAFIVAFLMTFSSSIHKIVLQGGITEPLYILLLWVAIFFSWLALTKNKISYYIFTSIFFGLAYLTRTEALPIFLVFLIVSFLQQVLKLLDIRNFKANVLNILFPITNKLGITVIIFFLICAPYIVIQSIHIGRPTFSGKYAYIGSGPFYALEKYRPTTWAQDVWAVDFNYFKSPYYDPDRASKWMIRYFKNGTITQNAVKSLKEISIAYQSINTNNFFVGIGMNLAIIGIILSIIFKKFRLMTIYFIIIWITEVIWIATFMPVHYRYLVFALPLFIYLQGVTIFYFSEYTAKLLVFLLDGLSKFLPKIFHRYKNQIGIVTLLILLVFFLSNYFQLNMSTNQFVTPVPATKNADHKLIGDWIKSQNIQVFGGRMEGIEFYSGAKIVYMPSSPPEEIIKYMKNWGVEYLLVRPFEVGYAFVAPIANPNFKHPDASLYYRFYEGSLVWKIKLTDEERRENQRVFIENNK